MSKTRTISALSGALFLSLALPQAQAAEDFTLRQLRLSDGHFELSAEQIAYHSERAAGAEGKAALEDSAQSQFVQRQLMLSDGHAEISADQAAYLDARNAGAAGKSAEDSAQTRFLLHQLMLTDGHTY